MKNVFKGLKRLVLMSILLAAVATVALGSVPSALAMNTPSLSPNPGTTVLGGTSTITVTADPNPNKLDHNRSTLGMYDPDNTSLGANSIVATNCRTGTGVGGTHWELRHSAAPAVPFVYTMDAVGDSFKVTFGTDAATTIFDITGSTGTSSTDVIWVDTSGGGDPALFDIVTNPADVFDQYTVRSCGFEEVTGVGGSDGIPFNVESGILVVEGVGGLILPIDATSLVIAGLFANGFWFLPIAVATAAGISIYRLRK